MLPALAAAAVTAAVVVGLVLPHHGSPQRAAVSRYVNEVNAVEQRMTYSLTQVMSAYRSFTSSRSTAPGTVQRLNHAERTLALLESRIAVLRAPPQAHTLRTLIIELVREETGVTREVSALARFEPGFRAAIARLASAATVLARRLAQTHGPTPHAIHGTPAQIKKAQADFTTAANVAAAQQAAAVATYDGKVLQVERLLRRLSPPAVLAPAYRSQLVALHATYVAGGRLASELRQTNRNRVSELSRAFAIASRLSQTTGAQQAEIAAVRAYDSRVRGVGRAAAAVRNELTRLARQLP